MLFVSASENKRLATILKVLRGMPVLAVGDMPNFAHSGGIINLKTVRNKVRFEINIGAAKRAQLKFSSKLLRRAESVWDGRCHGRDRCTRSQISRAGARGHSGCSAADV